MNEKLYSGPSVSSNHHIHREKKHDCFCFSLYPEARRLQTRPTVPLKLASRSDAPCAEKMQSLEAPFLEVSAHGGPGSEALHDIRSVQTHFFPRSHEKSRRQRVHTQALLDTSLKKEASPFVPLGGWLCGQVWGISSPLIQLVSSSEHDPSPHKLRQHVAESRQISSVCKSFRMS